MIEVIGFFIYMATGGNASPVRVETSGYYTVLTETECQEALNTLKQKQMGFSYYYTCVPVIKANRK